MFARSLMMLDKSPSFHSLGISYKDCTKVTWLLGLLPRRAHHWTLPDKARIYQNNTLLVSFSFMHPNICLRLFNTSLWVEVSVYRLLLLVLNKGKFI